ncbi:MAG: hypothetical protein JSV84_00845 [Gemmatimonadota bacterium]|nr:MAG: hypothetical protein JSV84_00845 [Gemmatimonadota bacterium]
MKAIVWQRLALLWFLAVLFLVTGAIAQTLPPGFQGGVPGGSDNKAVPDMDPEQIRKSKIRSILIWRYEAAPGEKPGEIIESQGFNVSSSTFDEAGHLLEQIMYNQDGTVMQQSNFVYDSKGYITESVTSSSKGGADQRMVYEYTEFDSVFLPTGAVAYKPDGSIQLTMKYQFNEAWQMVELLMFSPDKNVDVKQFLSYDEEGRIIETFVRNSKGDVISRILYTYETDAMETVNYGPNSMTVGRTRSIFNPDSTVAEVLSYNAEDKVTSRTSSTYDTEGRVIETHTSVPSADIRTRNVFNYDDRGNIIEQIQYNKLDEPVRVLKYSYDYFE